jgi:hypothetical protein
MDYGEDVSSKVACVRDALDGGRSALTPRRDGAA